MWHKLFNLAVAVSLILCATAGVFWVRSYLAPTTGNMVSFGAAAGTVFRAVPLFARADRFVFVGSAPGRVLFIQQTAAGSVAAIDASHCGVFGSPDSVVVYSPIGVVAQGGGLLGFGHASVTFPAAAGASATVISIPFWVIVMLTLALPLVALRRRLRDIRWLRQGRCRACGYDLRATPGRCPECGAAAPKPAETAA
jgi:hypothetical protein